MIDWRRRTEKFSNGSNGYVNKYVWFSTAWDSMYSSDDPQPPWVLLCKLPGLKERLGRFETEIEAYDYAEKCAEIWINNSGLQIKESI